MGGLDDVSARPSLRTVQIRRVDDKASATEDVVATEEPLEIRLEFDGSDGERVERSISITMRTPGHDEELAIGFLFSEGIVRKSADVLVARPCGPPAPNGLINVVRVELARGVEVALDRLERHFYTSSSCGVCGKASLDAVAVQGHFDIGSNAFSIAGDLLVGLPGLLRSGQAVFAETGGLHASGLFDASGEVIAVREDVGRHNALDKLIGSRLRAGSVPLERFGIALSGRASFELMQKAMMAGCPVVAAVGAPSSLAVELAADFGITLVGFLKPEGFNIYTHPGRIRLD
jgi:FdhD protein